MCIPPEIRAEAGWTDEIHGGRRRAFRMEEVEGTCHGLEPNGVAVHLHGRKGHCVRSLVSCPPSGRLYGVEDLEKSLKGGVRVPQLMWPFRVGIGTLSPLCVRVPCRVSMLKSACSSQLGVDP